MFDYPYVYSNTVLNLVCLKSNKKLWSMESPTCEAAWKNEDERTLIPIFGLPKGLSSLAVELVFAFVHGVQSYMKKG